MSALDGPGLRSVVFMQGCPLRCAYCHNPDTWEIGKGESVTVNDLIQRVLRYKAYFGATGGVTVSGGEATLQAEFLSEFFTECRKNDISTVLDTSGAVLNENVVKLLEQTDLCILDIKMTNEQDYKKYTRGSLAQTLKFLEVLEKMQVKTWIRQVIVPDINDTAKQVLKLKALCEPFSCIGKIELLAFRKLCISKYNELGIDFPLKDSPETTPERIDELTKLL